MRTNEKSLKNTLGRLLGGALLAGGLATAGLVGGASAASAAPVGPCDRAEGIYAWSGDINFYVQNCRSTTVNLQAIIVDGGAVTHREGCTSVAPGNTMEVRGGVPTMTAHWTWTYC